MVRILRESALRQSLINKMARSAPRLRAPVQIMRKHACLQEGPLTAAVLVHSPAASAVTLTCRVPAPKLTSTADARRPAHPDDPDREESPQNREDFAAAALRQATLARRLHGDNGNNRTALHARSLSRTRFARSLHQAWLHALAQQKKKKAGTHTHTHQVKNDAKNVL